MTSTVMLRHLNPYTDCHEMTTITRRITTNTLKEGEIPIIEQLTKGDPAQ